MFPKILSNIVFFLKKTPFKLKVFFKKNFKFLIVFYVNYHLSYSMSQSLCMSSSFIKIKLNLIIDCFSMHIFFKSELINLNRLLYSFECDKRESQDIITKAICVIIYLLFFFLEFNKFGQR